MINSFLSFYRIFRWSCQHNIKKKKGKMKKVLSMIELEKEIEGETKIYGKKY